ncbi:MAG: ACT domain-containing protein [Clostridia bacterium]|nr:ACT domain-containing protein [Clostridia bacterium]
MSLKQISVFVENKPGKMQHLTEVLAQNNVDMRALSLAETSDFGIVRIIVDDVYAASTILKEEGFIHSVTKVLGVSIPDEPGGLNKVLKVLTEAQINVEYMYAFLGGKDVDHAYMIFKVEDRKAAVSALAAKGIRCVDQQELEQL